MRAHREVDEVGTLSAPSSRDKILDVAEGLFARRGFAGVGMREVAETAGLGKSSLFHHFRSKAQLYLAVMDRLLARIEARLGAALAAASPADLRLERWIDALVDDLAEHPPAARLLLRGLFEDEAFDSSDYAEGAAVEARLAAILAGIQSLLEEGMQEGVLRRVSKAHAVQTLIGATVYHFASGDFGEELFGGPLHEADAVRRRKQEVKTLLRHGLAPSSRPESGA